MRYAAEHVPRGHCAGDPRLLGRGRDHPCNRITNSYSREHPVKAVSEERVAAEERSGEEWRGVERRRKDQRTDEKEKRREAREEREDRQCG